MANLDVQRVVVPTLVTGGVLLYYNVQGFHVGNARQKFGIKAPATTGHPDFERLFRAHLNTLESLGTFLPSYWLFVTYVNAPIGNGLGALFLLGRVLYGEGYAAAAEKREAGALISFASSGLLLVGTIGSVAFALATKRSLPFRRP